MASILKIYLISLLAFSQSSTDELALNWIHAIKNNKTSLIEKYIHPKCSKEKIRPNILKRMVAGDFDKEYKVEVKELTASKEILKKAYQVIPSHQLNLKYSNKKKFGFGKGFPISKYKGSWYFVVCTN